MSSMLRLIAIVLGLTLALNAPAFAQGKGKGKGEQPDIIQLDLSKLPPELAKQLLELSKSKEKTSKEKSTKKPKVENTGAPNAISLSKAVSIAEKAGQGKATNASRRDRADQTTFTVEVKAADGEKIKFTLDAIGTITKQQKGEKD